MIEKQGRAKLSAYLGLFFFSLTLLMAEIVYTRTARVSFGYTYQLLIISLAISGIGFGGIPVFFLARRIASRFDRLLVSLSLIYAVSLPIPFLTVNKIGGQLAFLDAPLTTLSQYFAAVFFVFFLGGMGVAAFLRRYDDKIPVVYFINLTGAAVGAFAVVPIMDYLGGETTVVVIYILSLATVSVFTWGADLPRSLKAGVLMFVLLSPALLGYLAPYLKAGGVNKEAVLSASNSFSQVDVYRVGPYGEALDLSPIYKKSGNVKVTAQLIVYDRLKKTYAIEYSRLSDVAYLAYDLNSFPYLTKKRPDVMIVGSGGGVDVVRARLAGSKSITAVEMNPLIIDIARDSLKTKAYDDGSVKLVIGEGRSIVSRSSGKFDLILLPIIGGPSDRGLNVRYNPDNYLNTREAYETYLDHLKTGGVLAVSNKNWIMKEFLNVGLSALKARGVKTEDSVAYIEGSTSSLAMFKPDGFSEAEKKAIRMNSRRLRFKAGFPAASSPDIDVTTPITDDRPFLSDKDVLARIFSDADQAEDINLSGQAMTMQLYGALSVPQTKPSRGNEFLALRFLAALALFGLLATFLLAVAPMFFRSVRTRKQSWRMLALAGYFICLGLGFIIFQLVMLQRSFLFVAHPSYSVALVLSSFLLFGGLGSLATQGIPALRFRVYVVGVAGLLALFLIAYAYLLNYIFIDLLVLSPAVRLPFLVVLLAIPCFLAGALFTLGLRTTRLLAEELIPWMWSVNGLAIVLGGAIGALGSFFIGFRFVLAVAGGFYLAALALFLAVKTNGKVLSRDI